MLIRLNKHDPDPLEEALRAAVGFAVRVQAPGIDLEGRLYSCFRNDGFVVIGVQRESADGLLEPAEVRVNHQNWDDVEIDIGKEGR